MRDPRDVMAWRLLGGALAQSANPDAALAAFEEACALQPDAAKNHYNAALTLLTLGRRDAARERFERALSLDPGYEQARLRLAELGGNAPSVAPPPLTPPVPSPTFHALGGGSDPIPPLPPGYRDGPARGAPGPVSATTPLVLGIVGLATSFMCVGLLLSPVAWVMADGVLKQLDASPERDQSQRGTAVAAKVLGIIGSVLGLLLVAGIGVAIVVGAFASDTGR